MQELHEELVAAGQAIRDTDSDTFLLTVGSENGVLKGAREVTSKRIAKMHCGFTNEPAIKPLVS